MKRAVPYAPFTPFAILGLALGLSIGCASPSAPEPESVAQKEAEASARAAAETPPPAPAEREPVREKIVVVEEGGEAAPTLAEASAAARAARAAAEPQEPPRRITNENLAEVARDGRVSFAGPEAGAPLAAGGGPAGPPAGGSADAARGEASAAEAAGREPAPDDATAAPDEIRDEAYWRRRARELRTEWRDTVDEVAELRERTADLRWQFYAEDDPWVRDSRIKPAWDEAIDRLRRAERAADGFRDRLDTFLDDGRRAGALPGWLREGIELEPAGEETTDEPNPAEPVEPVIVDEAGEGSR